MTIIVKSLTKLLKLFPCGHFQSVPDGGYTIGANPGCSVCAAAPSLAARQGRSAQASPSTSQPEAR